MRHLIQAIFCSAVLFTATAASADRFIFTAAGAQYVNADQSEDGTPYWKIPYSSGGRGKGYVQVDVVDRACAGYDTCNVSFNGNMWFMRPDGVWIWVFPDPRYLSNQTTNLSLLAPDSTTIGNWNAAWWMERVAGGGSARGCNYVDPGRKGGTRCGATVSFSFDIAEWIFAY